MADNIIGADESREDPYANLDPSLRKLKKKWDEKKEQAKKGAEKVKKPLMNAIDAMRAEMCWQRDKLWEHEKCLKFLAISCFESSTGTNLCKHFRDKLKTKCSSTSVEAIKKLCSGFKAIGIIKDEDKTTTPVPDADKDGIPDDKDPDLDNDGVANDKDLFPNDKSEWSDLDGDGVGDSHDEDIDGDGVPNGKDKFPKDASEWADLDGDGKGDEKDEDLDGDGVVNANDAFPRDPSESEDLDKDGIGDSQDEDIDGDGVPNDKDAFPRDSSERNDLDGDGIGDSKDTDRDGDGAPNEKDKHPDDSTRQADTDGDRDKDGVVDSKDTFPDDPKEWADLDGDGIGDNSDPDIDGDGYKNDEDSHPRDPTKYMFDRDGDGVPDDVDAFPDDPSETKDTDKDGVGDNADEAPEDPSCTKLPCRASATSPEPNWADKINKVEKKLPPDGYDEYTPGRVEHDDMITQTHDWRKEWPSHPEDDAETIRRICSEQPDNTWCQRHGYTSR